MKGEKKKNKQSRCVFIFYLKSLLNDVFLFSFLIYISYPVVLLLHFLIWSERDWTQGLKKRMRLNETELKFVRIETWEWGNWYQPVICNQNWELPSYGIYKSKTVYSPGVPQCPKAFPVIISTITVRSVLHYRLVKKLKIF